METDDVTPAPAPAGDFLKSLPTDTVQRAKHIVSHLLLPEGATVLDLDCGTGALTAAMAYFNPRLKFTGLDRNRQLVKRARARFAAANLPNLSFDVGDIMSLRRADDSADAMVVARALGEVYTRAGYDDTRVAEVLGRLYRTLRPDGLLLLHDYAMPAADDFVQIEFPVPVRDPRHFRLYGAPIGETQGEREIELLQWFSLNARAHDAVKGFYLEELAPHVPYTRLFRLPAKWAYEFIIRKQDIRRFKAHIGHQYTCLTEDDYERVLGRTLGARVQYSAPWHSPHMVRAHCEGAFRLYTADGKPLGYPPAAHIVVAQKIAAGKPQRVEELRPAQDRPETLALQSVRDDRNGEVTDVVGRAAPRVDILPYFLDAAGRLKVVLQADHETALVNATPRNQRNLDGKRWSGHIATPPSLSIHDLEGFDHASAGAVARLMVQHFGLRPQHGAMFEEGLKGFPAPSMIDERLETLYIAITAPDMTGPRAAGPIDTLRLRVYDAQDVLRATGAGFIPSAWLDIQMQDLMTRKGQKITPWLHEAIPLSYDPPPADQLLRAGKILKQKPKGPEKPARPLYTMGAKATKWPNIAGTFRPIRGATGQITTRRSAFVEQGRMDGTTRGLSAHDMDFACPQPDLMNIAAILPLTEDLQGRTLVGFEFAELPVPSRFGQDAPMMNLPTLPLPASIATLDDARAYVAEQFDVEPARVAPMGESFFTMSDLMPQRVFPFALTRYPRRRNLRMRYTTLDHILDIIDTDFADSVLWKWGFANALLCHEHAQVQGFAPRTAAKNALFGQNAPKHSSAAAGWYKSDAGNDRPPQTAQTPAEARIRHE